MTTKYLSLRQRTSVEIIIISVDAAARMSAATLYNWKAKYGGLDVSEAKRLKALEDENAKLKRLLADAMLDAAALKELPENVWSAPS